MEPDFTGFATRFGIKCADGRTIMSHAFQALDGAKVPLVWQHQHDSPENVLGHVILKHVNEGMRAEGFFNDTDAGQNGKKLVKHGDVKALSIYANQLIEKAGNVLHGVIREVSLVLSGANPGAVIDNVNLAHSDGVDYTEEAIIFTADEDAQLLVQGAAPPSTTTTAIQSKPALADLAHAVPMAPASSGVPSTEQTVEDVVSSMSEMQRQVMYGLIGQALEDNTAQQSATAGDDPASTATHSDNQEGNEPVGRNVFDQTAQNGGQPAAASNILTHDAIQGIFAAAHKGGSLKEAVEEFALAHGIDNISTLFPLERNVTDTPDFISRRMQWVSSVLGGVHKTPFSRIRSWSADITIQQARAKGYVKGALKREEFFRISRRVTTPQTIYKKQKLDRDDILDITDFDVVNWLQQEMRIMLDEELARAILIGDGRDVADPDKINSSNVRPIYGDDEMYATVVNVDLSDANSFDDEIVDGVVNGMRFYYGSGNPVLYTSLPYLTRMLLAKDTQRRRLYPTKAELMAALGVSDIQTVQSMEEVSGLIGIIVNLADYTVGADRGGEVSTFDQFDIDYNQFKYLMETRVSGALTKYRSAIVIQEFSGAGGMLPNPTAPTFDVTTGIGTIPTTTNVHYVTVDDDGVESSSLSAGAQTAIASGAYVTYRAKPNSTFEFSSDTWDWTFRRD